MREAWSSVSQNNLLPTQRVLSARAVWCCRTHKRFLRTIATSSTNAAGNCEVNYKTVNSFFQNWKKGVEFKMFVSNICFEMSQSSWQVVSIRKLSINFEQPLQEAHHVSVVCWNESSWSFVNFNIFKQWSVYDDDKRQQFFLFVKMICAFSQFKFMSVSIAYKIKATLKSGRCCEAGWKSQVSWPPRKKRPKCSHQLAAVALGSRVPLIKSWN